MSQIARRLALFEQKEYLASDSNETEVILRTAAGAKDNAGIISEIVNRYPADSRSGFDDFAVLWRHPGASVEVEHSLILKGMAYKTVGFVPFLRRPEIAFIRMLLSVAVDHPTKFQPESLAEAKRAVWQFLGVNLPSPASAEETASLIETATESKLKSYGFPDLLGQVDRVVGQSIQASLEIAGSDDARDIEKFVKALNFQSLAQRVFVSQSDIEEAMLSIESFAAVSAHYDSINAMLGAMNSIDFQHRKPRTAATQIRLSTIEDAKGLEFRHVFVPDCNIGTFNGPEQDERNLFYVAISRARNTLVISYQKGQASAYLKHFL